MASGTHAGSYADSLGDATGTGLGNYTISYVNGSLQITPAVLVLDANADTKVYDGTVLSSGLVSASNLQGADGVTASQHFLSKDVLGTNGSTLAVDAGYTIHDGNGGNNYTVVTHSASGTITPAPLTVSGDTTSSTYTATSQANTFTTSGLLGGDSVTGVTGPASGTPGRQLRRQLGNATGTGLGNYTISYVNGSLQITPALLTVSGGTTSSTYTAASQANTFTTSGLLGGDSVTGVSGLTGQRHRHGDLCRQPRQRHRHGAGQLHDQLRQRQPADHPGTADGERRHDEQHLHGDQPDQHVHHQRPAGGDSVTGVSGLGSGTNTGTYADNLGNATGAGQATTRSSTSTAACRSPRHC
ncbi:hypothetical protein H1235_03235 [Pseudoxanthomonas sp. NC8]|nr:hypothetical protein H1235_03235 [Pseudoxanthomonas sp. NC8]